MAELKTKKNKISAAAFTPAPIEKDTVYPIERNFTNPILTYAPGGARFDWWG